MIHKQDTDQSIRKEDKNFSTSVASNNRNTNRVRDFSIA